MKKFQEDICIRKDDFLVVQTKEVEFNNPTVFVTFPSPGIVGPIIARQMIESLQLEEIGFFKSNMLSPVTIFIDNVLKHPYLIYANKEGTMILITIEYPVPQEGYLVLAEGLLNWIEKHVDAKTIVCLDGIPVKLRPEKPVVITAAEKEVVEELKQYGAELYDHGVVLGLSGAFMSEALLREIVGIVLMTPATSELPDPEAAVTLINVINDYYSVSIETAPLLEQATKIKEQLAMVAEKQQSIQQPLVPPPRKYREGFT
ncbi:MAG: proteasome assembly chaperone family protein [Candidatus Heimdallarchaeota archaeon]|nr:proteasome assembly chaperone family protein [Candidatus Heimdallarchaeota archaeon]MCK4955748.1 proteasome assembly chaperone family protein [Candidatus Heimdallarchaeota archaeon]